MKSGMTYFRGNREKDHFHITNFPFLSKHSLFGPPMAFLSHNSSDMPGLVPLMHVYSDVGATFQ